MLLFPPHYSDLQPIELLWAYIKENIWRECSKVKNLSIAKTIQDTELKRINTDCGSTLKRGIINHVYEKIIEV